MINEEPYPEIRNVFLTQKVSNNYLNEMFLA